MYILALGAIGILSRTLSVVMPTTNIILSQTKDWGVHSFEQLCYLISTPRHGRG
jgi:hypothetical protein